MNRAVLDKSSLARTLWNLEEARLRGAANGDEGVREALEWVAGRQGMEGS